MISEIKVKLKEGAFPLSHAHDEDAGFDICTPKAVYLPSHSSVVVDTGVCVEIPRGYAIFLKSKSGLNVVHSIIGDGVVDAGFTGSIRVKLYNHSNEPHTFNAGDKLIQLVILPIETPRIVYVDEISGGERGMNGFGSTGK